MHKTPAIVWLFACAATLLACGCSSDSGSDGSGPNPVTAVNLDPAEMSLEVGHARQLTATVTGGDNKDLAWYVNDIENGNEIVGEITENSPVTYTAPDYLPLTGTLLIKAVSVEDTTKYDSCLVNITFTKFFVDPGNGSDLGGNGGVNLPFKTLTHASEEADSGMTIFAQPGVYSEDTGETFPIHPGAEGMTIEGMDWEQCVIRGHALVGAYYPVVSLGGYVGASFRKFTLEQGLPADETDVTLFIGGIGNRVDSIRIFERAGYAVCRAENATGPVIENCVFVVDDGVTADRGINLFPNSNGGIVRNCTLTGFNIALRITNTSDLLVEGCIIEGNATGIEVGYEDSPGSINPDFGGGARGSLGGNIIRDNSGCGLWFDLPHPIYAKYNTWDNDPPVAGVDYCKIGDGGLILE